MEKALTDLYTRVSETYEGCWYAFEYTAGRHKQHLRFMSPSLEAGRQRADGMLARMSLEYSGRLPPGRYARNNTISMTNNRRKKR